jgi:hypothetical protein
MKKSKKLELDATEPMDYVPFDETPEFIEKRKSIKIPSFQERFHESIDLPEELMKEKQLGKYNVPLKMDIDKNIHLPDSDVSKYVTKQQAKGKLFNKLSGILSSPVAKYAGKAAKFASKAAKIAPILAVPMEALASEDVGDEANERSELEKAKQEFLAKKKEESLSSEERQVRQKMNEKAMEPITSSDMLRIKSDEDYKKPIGSEMFEALTGAKIKDKEPVEIVKDSRPRSQRYSKLIKHMYGEK